MSDEIKVAIVIQPVIRGDKGYSGICFSRNPNNGNDKLTGEYLDKSLGDKLASGEVTPKQIKNEFGNINGRVLRELTETAYKLEKHFKHVQDIEFVYDGQETYFVQTRNAKLSPTAQIKTLIDYYNEGIIDLDEFKKRYNPELHKQVQKVIVDGCGTLLFTGTPAVNGTFTGKATFDKTKADEHSILFVDITTPDDMPYLNKIGALVTKIGGITSHPAVVCRELKKPCVVGLGKYLSFGRNGDNRRAINCATHEEINEGDVITVIGDTGEIYSGEVTTRKIQLFVEEVNKILNNEDEK